MDGPRVELCENGRAFPGSFGVLARSSLPALELSIGGSTAMPPIGFLPLTGPVRGSYSSPGDVGVVAADDVNAAELRTFCPILFEIASIDVAPVVERPFFGERSIVVVS